jgi:hypothetical protein
VRRTLLVALLAALAVPAAASPARAQAGDILTDGWSSRTWHHLGEARRGAVSAESWVDLDWPCLDDRDVGQDCDIQRVRGHGLVEKLAKVARVEIGLVRLGRYPAGTLVQNGTNRNSGSRRLVEQTTAWYPVSTDGCDNPIRAWTRTSFAVRWTDRRLTKLSLLGRPTDARVCSQTAALTTAQRRRLRSQLLG